MVCARCLALAKAGSIIPAKTGSISKDTPDVQMPAIASPWPCNRPPLPLIFISEMMPSGKPMSDVNAAVQNPRTPSTSDAIAIPLVVAGPAGSGGWSGACPGGAGGRGPAPAASASANSGNSANGLHVVVPSACTNVRPSARRSAIHWRSTSALIGPYSFWSAPWILNIGFGPLRWVLRQVGRMVARPS